MKTAISIPDNVFRKAERFARSRKLSRSRLYAIAVDEYIRHQPSDEVTKLLNEVYTNANSSLDGFHERLQTHSILKDTW